MPKLRAQHVRPLWLGLFLFLAACQGPDEFHWGAAGEAGLAGSAPTGAAGSVSGAAGTVVSGAAGTVVSGAAGTVVSGAAGTVVSGAAGTGTAGSSAGGAGGTSGTAGTTGAAGTTGSPGSGGAGGATGGGAAGRGGATGAGGAAGGGGAGGTAGSTGRGGTGGAAGRGGRGGTAGSAGTTGTAGTSGGMNSCPAAAALSCTSAGSLELTPDGQVVDFSAAEWNATAAKWCDAHGLDGSLFSFVGMSSTAAAVVDTTARNLRLNLTVGAGQYAGGGVYFDSCVDASAFDAIQFTGSLTGGSLTGCVWQVQLQTQDQRPTTLTNPTGGTCNASTTTCYRYPAASLAAATAAATTFTVPFTSFSNTGSTIATPTQVVGLQWQVNSGMSGMGTCTVELRIDNVRFQ